jgi:hypothetical protein
VRVPVGGDTPWTKMEKTMTMTMTMATVSGRIGREDTAKWSSLALVVRPNQNVGQRRTGCPGCIACVGCLGCIGRTECCH